MWRVRSLVCMLICAASLVSGAQGYSATTTPTQSAADSSIPPSADDNTAKFTAAKVVNITPTHGLKEDPLKRNIKAIDSTLSASGKSYDPPPEFHRGPGSVAASTTFPHTTLAEDITHSRVASGHQAARTEFLSKATAYNGAAATDTGGRNNYAGSEYTSSFGNEIANDNGNWQHLRSNAEGFGADSFHDRISVGHHGSANLGALHSQSSQYSSSYEGTPRPPHIESYGHLEYGGPPEHYQHSGHGEHAHTAASYYGGNEGLAGDGIHFDVYGTRGGHYGAGGDYSYTHPELHETAAYKGHPQLSPKALLAKSFLIPLASAAVLGIAAALVSNPLLLQLGTVSALGPPTVVGKRKRRDLMAKNRYAAHGLAYRKPLRQPQHGMRQSAATSWSKDRN